MPAFGQKAVKSDSDEELENLNQLFFAELITWKLEGSTTSVLILELIIQFQQVQDFS